MTRTGTMMARLIAGGLRSAVAFAAVFAVAGTAIAVDAGPHPEDEEARRIIEAAGIHGGLVVRIGCRDGKLTVALGTNDCCDSGTSVISAVLFSGGGLLNKNLKINQKTCSEHS